AKTTRRRRSPIVAAIWSSGASAARRVEVPPVETPRYRVPLIVTVSGDDPGGAARPARRRPPGASGVSAATAETGTSTTTRPSSRPPATTDAGTTSGPIRGPAILAPSASEPAPGLLAAVLR